jgi:hypothetical protein
MTMSARLRKLTLTTHVAASVGWFGALAVFLAHAAFSLISDDAQIVRAMDLAMGLTAWFVILPFCIASLITGLVQALGTPWGLFRHYWVLAKLLLTVLATIVLLLKLGPIRYLADAAAQTAASNVDLIGLRTSIMVHAVGGLLILLATATLAVYKPLGMTPYGIRKRRELGDPVVTDSMPYWVKAFVVIAGFLVLLTVIMMLSGEHGPTVHNVG